MNSPTHVLVALALLSKKDHPRRFLTVFAGSVIPDAFIYASWIWLTFVRGESQARIWDEIYFNPPMQLTASTFNSVPLYAVLAGLGYGLVRSGRSSLLWVFALAALSHIALDFPVHAHDAYAHFWPVTDWKFHSPISYWEGHLHARWVNLVEMIIALTCIAVVWRRFDARWVKAVLCLFAVLYIVLQVMMWLAPLGSAG